MILTKNGNLMKFASGAAVNAHIVDPYNPLGLPPFTIRCKFKSGYTPSMGDSQTLVDSDENIWDIYKNSTDWSKLFLSNTSILNVLGANTTGVLNMSAMLRACSSLSAVSVFNTSTVTNLSYMFIDCSAIRIIPLFDTSNVTDISSMLMRCKYVETGALALYQQASTQTNPPTSHAGTFTNCGSQTTTGQAELRQIPSSWGGWGS